MMWVLVLPCFAVLIPAALGIEIAFEKMEQLAGFDVLESTLRVRKYNRTTMTLNGTVTIKLNMDDSFVVHMDLFHSRLGNQQFNHYPMKLPTKGLCAFITDVHDNYAYAVQDYVNYPKKGECPITPRQVHIYDQLFPTKAVPPTFPKGLWKAVICNRVGEVERTKFELVLKAYSDQFF